MNNNNSVKLQQFTEPKMVQDIHASLQQGKFYFHGRNLTINELGVLEFEQGNKLVISAPYTIINATLLPKENEILIFSTDNLNSEIGIGNMLTGEYITLKNNKCLDFKTDYPIQAVIKSDVLNEWIVYFTDKYNPVRRATKKELKTLENCDDILLWKKIDFPNIQIKGEYDGNLPDGAYSVFFSYTINNIKYSEYYSIPNKIHLYSEKSNNGSVEITLKDLDKEFLTFDIVLVANIDGVKTAHIYKNYQQNKIIISSLSKETIPIGDLTIKSRAWDKAGIISSNSSYLLLADLVGKKELDYQRKLDAVEAEYVVIQVPFDFYRTGGTDFGYWRDERYSFQIQGEYDTGDSTPSFHIFGPNPKAKDLSIISNELPDICENDSNTYYYQLHNTAGELILENNKFYCGKRILGRGKLGFWRSTELYPNNKDLYGEYAGKPIQYFMMPNEQKVPRYSNINGQYYINIIAIQFKNIPEFEDKRIKGYKITRCDREGNKSVISRGIATNSRGYFDNQENSEIIYSNYPYNSVEVDPFLSEKQTSFKNKKERNYKGLSKVYYDKINFYSPHNYFFQKYKLGNQFFLESEEVGTVIGKFEPVYNHPDISLLTQFSFWLAAAIGIIQANLVLLGGINFTSESASTVGVPTNTKETRSGTKIEINTVDDLIRLSLEDIATAIATSIASFNATGGAQLLKILKLVKTILLSLVSLGLKAGYSILTGISEANKIIEIIQNFLKPINYAYQYNSKCFYNQQLKVENKKYFSIFTPEYINEGLHNINDFIYNNYNKETSVFVQLNKPLPTLQTKDTSLKTVSGFKLCNDINKSFTSQSSVYYITSKINNPSQYGQIGSNSLVLVSELIKDFNQTPILFGGDCIIAKFRFNKSQKLFYQDLGDTTFPDKTEYDYRLYRNIGYPRYWIDSTKFDFSSLISKTIVNEVAFSRTTTSKYNLDCIEDDKTNKYRVDDAYFYTSVNGISEFFAEADYNISFREEEEKDYSFIFRADRLKEKEKFSLNRAYRDLNVKEIFNTFPRIDYSTDTPYPTEEPNSVIYSLPSSNLQVIDNWRYFLPGNYFSFRESDFGNLVQIHKMDQDRLLFLMSRSSPFISLGRDFLELEQSGRKVLVGDGGLFAQDPREIMPTHNRYGASANKYAFNSNQFGHFYPSEKQTSIFEFTQGLNDIKNAGLVNWCNQYMPFKIKQKYPTLSIKENPIIGFGYLIVFDSDKKILYITKKDFYPKPEWEEKIEIKDGHPYINNIKIPLQSEYFNDISFTLSYSPMLKSFISFHDWHPNLFIQTEKHFLSVKNNEIWQHNNRKDLYSNFYGKSYPIEIEFIDSDISEEILRSIECTMESWIYKTEYDAFHHLNKFFDTLIVSNSEQSSPVLTLNLKKSLKDENIYPKLNKTGFDILYSKEENKYRINQFWDATRDRGEFTDNEFNIWITDHSGYKKIHNSKAIDLNKKSFERKKIRGKYTKYFFALKSPGNIKGVIINFLLKKLKSIR